MLWLFGKMPFVYPVHLGGPTAVAESAVLMPWVKACLAGFASTSSAAAMVDLDDESFGGFRLNLSQTRSAIRSSIRW